MAWKQIRIECDPLWQEFHKQVMVEGKGRCNLKVWHGGAGIQAALLTMDGCRSVTHFPGVNSMSEAKAKALEWAQPHKGEK
jgi:hypothetical protein